MTELTEVWTAIAEVLANDATLTGLLASPSDIYYHEGGDLPKQIGDPSIRLSVVSDNPDTRLSALGKLEPRLQIDIFGTSAADRQTIKARLETLLEIPRSRPEPIETPHFRVTRLIRRQAVPIDTPVTRSGKRLVQLSTDWTLTVVRRPTP